MKGGINPHHPPLTQYAPTRVPKGATDPRENAKAALRAIWRRRIPFPEPEGPGTSDHEGKHRLPAPSQGYAFGDVPIPFFGLQTPPLGASAPVLDPPERDRFRGEHGPLAPLLASPGWAALSAKEQAVAARKALAEHGEAVHEILWLSRLRIRSRQMAALLDSVDWPFPTFRVCRRPFDQVID